MALKSANIFGVRKPSMARNRVYFRKLNDKASDILHKLKLKRSTTSITVSPCASASSFWSSNDSTIDDVGETCLDLQFNYAFSDHELFDSTDNLPNSLTKPTVSTNWLKKDDISLESKLKNINPNVSNTSFRNIKKSISQRISSEANWFGRFKDKENEVIGNENLVDECSCYQAFKTDCDSLELMDDCFEDMCDLDQSTGIIGTKAAVNASKITKSEFNDNENQSGCERQKQEVDLENDKNSALLVSTAEHNPEVSNELYSNSKSDQSFEQESSNENHEKITEVIEDDSSLETNNENEYYENDDQYEVSNEDIEISSEFEVDEDENENPDRQAIQKPHEIPKRLMKSAIKRLNSVSISSPPDSIDQEIPAMLIGVPAFRHADEDISVIVEAVTQRGEYYDDTGDYTDYSSDDTLNIQHQNFYNCSSYKKGSLIQFNKTAELLIYDTYNENILENIKGVSQLSLANESIERPILKTKSNTNAEQETIRARHCDDVTVEDFIAFFESHERKRMKSEPMLSEVRQKQIAKYYNRND